MLISVCFLSTSELLSISCVLPLKHFVSEDVHLLDLFDV